MTQDLGDTAIATPVAQRLRRWRQRSLPVIVWVLAVVAAGVLAQRQGRYIDAVGIVERHDVAVAPLVDGTVHSLSVDLFDYVDAGQTLALMDDTLVTAELMVAEAELARLGTALERENNRLEFDVAAQLAGDLNELRRFMVNEETARLDYLDRIVQRETDQVTLQRLGILLERQQGLVKERIIDADTYDATRLEYQALETQLAENEAAIALAQTRVEQAARRRTDRERQRLADADAARFLMPIAEAIAVQEACIEEIRDRRMKLVLKTPLAGQVSSIVHRTGETVLAGDPLLTITDPASARVLAYVDERFAHRLRPGMNVELRSQRPARDIILAKVTKVGAQIDPFPMRLWRSPLVTQWGRPVIIGNIPADRFLPGEALQLRVLLQTQ